MMEGKAAMEARNRNAAEGRTKKVARTATVFEKRLW
jgi:hypothetical protein